MSRKRNMYSHLCGDYFTKRSDPDSIGKQVPLPVALHPRFMGKVQSYK